MRLYRFGLGGGIDRPGSKIGPMTERRIVAIVPIVLTAIVAPLSAKTVMAAIPAINTRAADSEIFFIVSNTYHDAVTAPMIIPARTAAGIASAHQMWVRLMELRIQMSSIHERSPGCQQIPRPF